MTIRTLKERYPDQFESPASPLPVPAIRPESVKPLPAPCLSGQPFQCPDGLIHRVLPGKLSVRGPICDKTGNEIKQLPDYKTGVQECPILRARRLKGEPVPGFVTDAEIKKEESD
jgi:hypothetical protein